MRTKALEQELRAFDFSLCHPVRARLLDKLLMIHREDNAAAGQHSHKWAAARLDEKELNWVAAAGTGGNSQNSEAWKERVTNHVEGKQKNKH